MNENNSSPHPDDSYFESNNSGADGADDVNDPQSADGQEPVDRERSRRSAHEKRSIRDIPLGEDRRRQNEQRRRKQARARRSHRRSSRGTYAFVAVLLVVFFFFAFVGVSLFSQAHITLVPQTERIELNESVSVVSDLEATGETEQLAYEIVTTDMTASSTLEATGEDEVSREATGEITVFNTYSEEDQPIVSQTRFETEDGRVYRSGEAFVLPGMSEDGEPGEVAVSVTAAEAGEEYNVEDAELTLPGLEGTDLAEGIYAETSTPITGGFVGVQNTIDSETEAEARESLREELSSDLRSTIAEESGQGSLLIDNSVFAEFQDQPVSSEGEGVEVSVQATAYAITVQESELARWVAQQYLTSYDDHPVQIQNIKDLEIALEEDDDLSLEAFENDPSLSLSGAAMLVWEVDTDELENDVAGANKDEAVERIRSFPGVDSAKLEIRPGFMRSLPSNTDKIIVELDDPGL